MFAAPPPPPPARVQCVAAAAAHYHASPALVWAIIRVEGGTTGRVSWNSNGSFDMGLMQINSVHLGRLAQFGISERELVFDECLNIFIGTWLLQRSILEAGSFWEGVGRYHSATPALNAAYRRKVFSALQELAR